MNTVSKRPIGALRGKVTVNCTICGCSRKRKIEAFVYENTAEGKAEATKEYRDKSSKEYTCRVCKSIKRELSK